MILLHRSECVVGLDPDWFRIGYGLDQFYWVSGSGSLAVRKEKRKVSRVEELSVSRENSSLNVVCTFVATFFCKKNIWIFVFTVNRNLFNFCFIFGSDFGFGYGIRKRIRLDPDSEHGRHTYFKIISCKRHENLFPTCGRARGCRKGPLLPVTSSYWGWFWGSAGSPGRSRARSGPPPPGIRTPLSFVTEQNSESFTLQPGKNWGWPHSYPLGSEVSALTSCMIR
jgi:hypothetical protein